MRLLLPFSITSGLAATALFSASAAQTLDRLWPHVTYKLLRFEAPNKAKPSWSRDDLLRAALATQSGSAKRPQIEGWIGGKVYAQVSWDHERYYVFRPVLGSPLAEVCYIDVAELPESDATPTNFLIGGGGRKWCSEPDRAQVVVSPAQQRERWSRGVAAETVTFRSPSRAGITVWHVTGQSVYRWPLPPVSIADVATISLLPATLSNARRVDRTLWLARLESGGWGIMLRYGYGKNASGCFLKSVNRALLPSEAWVTPEVERWCKDRAARYFSSLPPDQRPAPIVGSPAVRTAADDW